MSIPPKNKEDAFIDQFVGFGDVSDLKENSIAIDATYYLSRIRGQEPLVTALGGPMAAEQSIIDDLDSWKANDTTPFFIFDGCLVKGEYEQTVRLGLEANYGTEHAWNLYAENKAQEAVTNFGTWSGAYRPQSLYPMLQSILRKRDLHFLVAPSKAVAQIAYFSREEVMCGAIMGPRELLLYPIKDAVIQEIDWESNKFTAIDRTALMTSLGVDESVFVDALLITGCSFLPPFPARAQPHQAANTVRDAVNMLRTNGKHVKQLCSSFDDVLLKDQPDWFDKFCKARMIVKHFTYINENGTVEIANDDTLTTDSHEYLGIKLPEELIYYMEYGLVGPSVPSWIIHSEATVPPTLDGIHSTEYRNLVLSQLLPVKELALGLVIPRLNRGLHYKDIEVKAWIPDSQPAIIRNSTFRSANPKVATWDIEENVVAQRFPSWSFTAPAVKDRAGSIAFEVLSLLNPDFPASTISKAGSKTRTDAAHHLVSSVIWRFLHLRDFVNDSHELTQWGKALATSLTNLESTVKKFPKVSGLFEALLLAFELIRFDQLNCKPRQDEVPKGGNVDESVLLASRCAVLLKLRHEAIGYTGPLRKDMLAYLSQVSAVREADRDLVDSITAYLFLNNKSKRDREPKEHFDIADALPFVNRNHNAAMGVAVRTYLEQRGNDDSEGPDMDMIAMQYFPKATNFKEDFEIFLAFFHALATGVKTLGQKELPSAAQDAWSQASVYLQAVAI